jgi:hypothetical protein
MADESHPHGKLLGLLVLLCSIFIAYFVRSAAEGMGFERLGVWYIAAWGFSIIAIDLSIRALWGRGTSPARYFHGRAGPHLASVASWMLGAVLVLFSFTLLGD